MLSETELRILNILRMNSRTKLREISKELNIPMSTLLYKLRRLEKELKLKHTTLIDYNKIGFHVKCFFAIKSANKEKTEYFLKNNLNINSLSKVNNNHHFFCEAIFESIEELEEFKQELEKQKIKYTAHFIIEEIKKESARFPIYS